MDATPHFEIAGGTVAGRHHASAGHNNQDAFAWRSGGAGLAAVVCDGCSSERHSEIGARLGAELLSTGILRALQRGTGIPGAIEEGLTGLLDRIGALAEAMGDRREAIVRCFLFTSVGLVLADGCAWSFALGDGLVAVDGRPEILGPFPGNQPPYLGYALLREAGLPATQGLRLQRHDALTSAVLGTDGALPLLDAMGALFADDLVFRNPDMVRRRLTVLARERRLDDDATLILVRRKTEEGS
jgi:hypothetical protein